MGIQIQAKIDGEYVTLVTTKSYDKDLKYSPAFQFDPVVTDDIRILYTSGNGTFANLKELEVYSTDGVLPMFDGVGAMAEPPVFIDCTTKNEGMAQPLPNEDTDGAAQLGTSDVVDVPSMGAITTGADESVISNSQENEGVDTVVLAVSIVVSAIVLGLIFVSIAVAYKKRKSIQ